MAKMFPNLQHLYLHSTNEDEEVCAMNAPVFRNLVFAFQHAFASTLRTFNFRYNDPLHGQGHYGFEAISNAYDARGIIQKSQLKHLTTETNCLLRTEAGNLRSVTISPLCLPETLESLYLRHEVSTKIEPEKQNLMYSEEAQCLGRLMEIFGKRSRRLPNLRTVVLAVFLPDWFDAIAARVIRKHARQDALVQLKVIFA